jgi:hypothetical protein
LQKDCKKIANFQKMGEKWGKKRDQKDYPKGCLKRVEIVHKNCEILGKTCKKLAKNLQKTCKKED